MGIEIAPRALRMGLLSGSGASLTVLASKTVPLPTGLVAESFSSPNVKDQESLSDLLHSCIAELSAPTVRRVGLSLPDGIFRVQTLEFDELPAHHRDRERLVRWRLEKGASFDASNTVLRFQALPRGEKAYTVLACVAKQEVVAQYEDLLCGVGLEPWAVAPSSFHSLNFYMPYLTKKDIPGFALAWVTETAYSTIIVEGGGTRFYRYKELKTGTAADVTTRLIREIDDSLHFYLHMDRQQQSQVGHLYLAGDPAVVAALSQSLKQEANLEIETLVPSVTLPTGGDIAPALAAAIGAGGSLT